MGDGLVGRICTILRKDMPLSLNLAPVSDILQLSINSTPVRMTVARKWRQPKCPAIEQ